MQESIFSSSHYAQWKITSSKYMKHVYKPNGTMLITQQCIVATVCVSLCSSWYTSRCMIMYAILRLFYSQLNVSLWMDDDTIHLSMKHPDLYLFSPREILRSSLLSSLWSEAAIATNYSKRVRPSFLELYSLMKHSIYDNHLWPKSSTFKCQCTYKNQQDNNVDQYKSNQGSNNQMLLV